MLRKLMSTQGEYNHHIWPWLATLPMAGELELDRLWDPLQPKPFHAVSEEKGIPPEGDLKHVHLDPLQHAHNDKNHSKEN